MAPAFPLVEGIHYHFFLLDMPYDVFASTYLLGEASGISPSVIYDRYAALGGNPAYIRGQSYLHMHTAESLGPEPGASVATAAPGEVRVDDPVESMCDTHAPGVMVGVTELVVPTEGLFFSMSYLLGSRLVPPLSGGRDPVVGIHIERAALLVVRASTLSFP